MPTPLEWRKATRAGAIVECAGAAVFRLKTAFELTASVVVLSFIYESTTAPKGEFEFENWVTWKNGNESGNKVEFRHEIEYGVTDRLQAALYLADWEVIDSKAGGDAGAHAAFQDTAVELIYSLTNPVTDTLRSALYGEFKIGPEHIGLESRIILQKNFDPIVLAYNAILEAEWEGEDVGVYDEQKGVFEQTPISWSAENCCTKSRSRMVRWERLDRKHCTFSISL